VKKGPVQLVRFRNISMFLVDADENQNFHGRIFVVITKSTTKLANPR